MLGAIVGDIVGSRFEFNNIKTKNFELFNYNCEATDDSIMTLAVASALIECRYDYTSLSAKTIQSLRKFGRMYPYPMGGYGGRFSSWLRMNNPEPYNSFGNGSAMRVSACGFIARDLEEAKFLSKKVTEVTHNHTEGIKGAEAVAVAIFLAKLHKDKEFIKEYITTNYYDIDFKLSDIRESYSFNESCQETVPQALECFFESIDFEDSVRNAISIGGDSDTLGAIVGGVAEAYYGIPMWIKEKAVSFLDTEQLDVLDSFYKVKI